jgi:hypothetical protein
MSGGAWLRLRRARTTARLCPSSNWEHAKTRLLDLPIYTPDDDEPAEAAAALIW